MTHCPWCLRAIEQEEVTDIRGGRMHGGCQVAYRALLTATEREREARKIGQACVVHYTDRSKRWGG